MDQYFLQRTINNSILISLSTNRRKSSMMFNSSKVVTSRINWQPLSPAYRHKDNMAKLNLLLIKSILKIWIPQETATKTILDGCWPSICLSINLGKRVWIHHSQELTDPKITDALAVWNRAKGLRCRFVTQEYSSHLHRIKTNLTTRR